MAESFYTSSSTPGVGVPVPAPSSSIPASPIAPNMGAAATVTPTPPPPPPKPTGPSHTINLNDTADPSLPRPPSAHPSPTPTPSIPNPSATQPGTINSPRPPPPIPTTAAQSGLGSSTPVLPQGQQAQQYTPIPPPSLADRWIPKQLEDKPIKELHPLVNNPSLLASLATTHPSYASSLVPLESAIQANIQLAQQVSQLESQLRQLRDETAQLLLNHTSLQSQWRRKQSEMDDALEPWGPRQMYQRLVASIGEQEAVLRAIQESFMEGSYDGNTGADGKASEKEVTDWVRRIREGATTLAKRREMRARWDEGRVGGWR
ncbi:hypothetical protein ABEF93_005007 [Exophiala dermatitidis]